MKSILKHKGLKAFHTLLLFLSSFTANYSVAQTHDSILVRDQNPNYLRSKKKFVKDTTILPKIIAPKPKDTVVFFKDSAEKKPKIITDKDDAIDYYYQRLKLAEATKNNTEIVFSLSELAAAYLQKKNFQKALEFYNKALQIQETISDKKAIITTLNAIGFVFSEQANFTKALTYYQKSYNIAEGIQDKKSIVDGLTNIGNIYFKLKDYSKAEEYYTLSLKKAKELGSSEKINTASNALSKIYAAQGNYKNAYEMHLLFKQTTDSLYKIEAQKTYIQNQLQNELNKQRLLDSLSQAESKKTIESKQTEVENAQKITYLILTGLLLTLLLAFSFYKGNKNTKQANKIIASQKEETEQKKQIIEKSLEEKEILLKEIHHRVKNNLQIISSLLSLQASRIENENSRKIIYEGKNRINAMALIHQKIYLSGNLASIDFQSYIEQMAEAIEKTFNTKQKAITYRINVNSIYLDIDTVIPLGLIINELLTNIYKYAFEKQDNGVVEIVLEQKNEETIELHISDNGIGLPENFDIGTSKSLGLKLVKGLSEQIKGTVRCENKQGAHFYISFKNPSLQHEKTIL